MTTPTPGSSFRLTFPLAGSNEPPFLLLDLAYATADQLKKLGGKARCFMTAQAVIMEVSGVAREQIEEFTNALGGSFSNKKSTFTVVLEERNAPEIDLDSESVFPGEYVSARMTKKFLFGLPDGAVVIGNAFQNGQPTFAVRLTPDTDRGLVWLQAVESSNAQRLCRVFWDLGGELESAWGQREEPPAYDRWRI